MPTSRLRYASHMHDGKMRICAAVQIFRSIDSEATMGLDIDTTEAYKRGLVTSAALCLDRMLTINMI